MSWRQISANAYADDALNAVVELRSEGWVVVWDYEAPVFRSPEKAIDWVERKAVEVDHPAALPGVGL